MFNELKYLQKMFYCGVPGDASKSVWDRSSCTTTTHWFWGFVGFGALLGFQIFCLNEQLGSLMVDLAHQLKFYLDF